VVICHSCKMVFELPAAVATFMLHRLISEHKFDCLIFLQNYSRNLSRCFELFILEHSIFNDIPASISLIFLPSSPRLLCLSLSLVQRQHQLIQGAGLDSSLLQDDLACLSGLAQGDKGVAWADQTRISTNDLHDVSTSSLSSTQQQLFDCFLEHSSPRLSRKMFPPKAGPHHSPHLGILTCTTAASKGALVAAAAAADQNTSQICPGEESDEGSTTPTPTTPISSQGSSGTVTLRTSHTFSACTPTHHSRTCSSSQNSALSKQGSNTSGSVRVTTDVCFSSDLRSPSPSSSYSERDDISEVSSSGLGSTNSDPMNSDPMQEQDELDYDKLASMSSCDRSRAANLPGIIKPTHYKWHRPLLPDMPLSTRDLAHHNRPSNTSNLPTAQPPPIPREAGTLSAPPMRRPLPARRDLITPPAPQPYSKFQPLQPPPRSSKGMVVSTNRRATPTSSITPTSTLGAHTSISTDSGLGSITGATIVPQGAAAGGGLRRTPLLPPHRPNANGVMVRSSPSNTLPHSSHLTGIPYTTRITNGFEDNFVSPPSDTPQLTHETNGRPAKTAKGAGTMKAPIGALLSPINRPFSARAAPNPYVQDPAYQTTHQNRPLTGTLSTGNVSSGAISIYQDGRHSSASSGRTPAFTTRRNAQSSTGRGHTKTHMSLSKQTSLSGSKGNLSDKEDAGDHSSLNSTFTVAVDVGCRGHPVGAGQGSVPSSGSSSVSGSGNEVGKKAAQGRGMFSRGRTNSKFPSYLKTTKSSESKKAARLVDVGWIRADLNL